MSADVEQLIAAGDLRAAADRLAPDDPARAAELYRRLLDHGRVADCLAAAGDGVAAARAALKAGDAARIAAIHARLLCGALPGLERATAAYVSGGRADLAADVAQALGRARDAAAFALEAGDGLRSGRLSLSCGDVDQAIDAFQRAMPEAGVELGRLHLRLDQPRSALAALAPVSNDPAAAPLLALVYLRLGLTEAARVVDPQLGDGVVARARLERELDAVVDPTFLGSVRVDGAEIGGDGASFVGELGAEPCLVRLFPTEEAIAQALVAFDPPLPGTPRLLRHLRGSRRLIVTRRGLRFSAWLRQEGSVRGVLRVLQSCARTLVQAHRRALIHGRLRLDDVRVLPGTLSTLDGWHRRWVARPALTQAADAMTLVAPEVQLGREATAASDVFSLGRLAELLLEDVDAGAFTEAEASRRPGMDAVTPWLGRLAPSGLRSLPMDRRMVVAGPEVRYEPLDGGLFRDVLLGRTVELVPEGADVDPRRILGEAVSQGGRRWVLDGSAPRGGGDQEHLAGG